MEVNAKKSYIVNGRLVFEGYYFILTLDEVDSIGQRLAAAPQIRDKFLFKDEKGRFIWNGNATTFMDAGLADLYEPMLELTSQWVARMNGDNSA